MSRGTLLLCFFFQKWFSQGQKCTRIHRQLSLRNEREWSLGKRNFAFAFYCCAYRIINVKVQFLTQFSKYSLSIVILSFISAAVSLESKYMALSHTPSFAYHSYSRRSSTFDANCIFYIAIKYAGMERTNFNFSTLTYYKTQKFDISKTEKTPEI